VRVKDDKQAIDGDLPCCRLFTKAFNPILCFGAVFHEEHNNNSLSGYGPITNPPFFLLQELIVKIRF
jgi:hypothetical protein